MHAGHLPRRRAHADRVPGPDPPKLKIAVVASLVTPLQPAQAGGAQAFVSDLAQGLAARGHKVEVYCAEGSFVPGVEVVDIPVSPRVSRALVMPAGREPERVPELRAGFEHLFAELRWRGADAISAHAFDADAIELAEDLPVLHTLHLPPLVSDVVRAARATSRRLATVSESARTLWGGAGVDAVVLPNGVPDWEPEPGPVEPLALIAGRISPEKGIEDGVAAARLAGLEPVVVGGAYDRGYAARLEVVVRPALPRPELWRLMARAAVTLMPVKWEEPFGLVAAEAQVAGCPVAGYARGALPEVVPEGEAGFLAPPDSIEGLAAAIRRCLTLDRRQVRVQARARLLLERAAGAYEDALECLR